LKDTKITGWVYSVETGKVSRLHMKNETSQITMHGWHHSDNANCVVYPMAKMLDIETDIGSEIMYYESMTRRYSLCFVHSILIYVSPVCFRITENAEHPDVTFVLIVMDSLSRFVLIVRIICRKCIQSFVFIMSY